MNKVNKDELLRSFKLFCINFVIFIIICLIVSKVYPSQKFDFGSIIMFAFAISVGSGIGYFNKYKKYAAKILYKDVINKDLVIELQKIMKKMHWSMKEDGSEKKIYKSSVFITRLPEYIEVTINKHNLELIGPQYYVEKIVQKLKA